MSRPKVKPNVYEIKNEGGKILTKISGNVTAENPEVVYIRTKVRIKPLLKQKGYGKEVESVKMNFEKFVKEYMSSISEFDRKKYIFTVDMTLKNVDFKKKSHFHYNLFLKPTVSRPMEEHYDSLLNISNYFNKYLVSLLQENGFACR